MDSHVDQSVTAPVFRKCVRCGYSLKGLPANHRCPECGLRFDERCALYRVSNPKQLLVGWIMIFGGGWVSLRNLPHLANLAGASIWDRIGALSGVLWIVLVAVGLWFLVKRFRRGLAVAITSDGLILRLPGFSDELIEWSAIGGATIKNQSSHKPQIARVTRKDRNKVMEIGGVANVFPTRADVERFVSQVNERTGADDPADEPYQPAPVELDAASESAK